MKTKTIPFNLEMVKKIQSGEVEGRLLMKPYKSEETYPVIILTCDAVHNRKIKGSIDIVVLVQFEEGDVAMQFNSDGYGLDAHGNDVRLLIELPEESIKLSKNASIEQLEKLKNYTQQIMNVNQHVIDNLNSMVRELREICKLPEQKHKFKPFDRVLVRSTNEGITSLWKPKFFSYTINGSYGVDYITTDDKVYKECIPYEGNEHLIGTTDKPKEE